jgi:hypothetical protein
LSALTKVFVILLVITSMLTTAGFVVFVNNYQPLATQLSAAQSQVTAANARLAAALQDKISAESLRDQVTASATQSGTDWSAFLNEALRQKEELTVTNAKLKSDNNQLGEQITQLTTGSNIGSSTVATLQGEVTDLRKENDKLVTDNDASSRTMADQLAQLETLNRENESRGEKLQSTQRDKELLAAALKQAGRDPDAILKGQTSGGPIVDITGQVREKSVIKGTTYVTINVGTSDGVAKGVVFNIIDGRSKALLAVAKVMNTDTNSCTASLEGDADKIAKVQAGNDAKTNVRGQ